MISDTRPTHVDMTFLKVAMLKLLFEFDFVT